MYHLNGFGQVPNSVVLTSLPERQPQAAERSASPPPPANGGRFGLSQDEARRAAALGRSTLNAYMAVSALGALIGAYHGIKRTDSKAQAFGYATLGFFYWPVALPIFVAQGFAKKG